MLTWGGNVGPIRVLFFASKCVFFGGGDGGGGARGLLLLLFASKCGAFFFYSIGLAPVRPQGLTYVCVRARTHTHNPPATADTYTRTRLRPHSTMPEGRVIVCLGSMF
jgi:hypothetical protein